MPRRWKPLRDLRAGFMPGWMPAAASARREKQDRGRGDVAWHIAAPPTAVMPRACGASSTPRPLGSIIAASGILDRPPQCAIAHKAGDDSWACHCERSEAIHRAAQGTNGLLRGACHRARIRATRWLAMTAVTDANSTVTTADMISRSRDMNCPRFASSFALIEKEGAGKTGCALHPRSRVQLRTKNAHTSIQVQRRASGLPCAMVLRRTS